MPAASGDPAEQIFKMIKDIEQLIERGQGNTAKRGYIPDRIYYSFLGEHYALCLLYEKLTGIKHICPNHRVLTFREERTE
jgi:hypothetical protein